MHNPIAMAAPYGYNIGTEFTLEDYFNGLNKLDFADESKWSSGALKYDSKKPRMDLIDRYALEELANVLGFGAEKYAAHNWRKGLSYSRLVAAALRHIHAFNDGEDLDPESGLPHVGHAMCCLMFLSGMTNTHPELDDRYTKE